MKGERRHELAKNELADWLAGVIGTIKPYRNAILGVVLLVVVASVSYSWWSRQSTQKTAGAWDQFYQALAQSRLNPTPFEDLAEQYPGTQLADWAATMAGDLHLTIGCDRMFTDKATAHEQLRYAIDCYTQVCEGSRSPMLRERATFGLARALEAQGKELDKAAKRYQQVVDNWPDGAYAAVAAWRVQDLKRPSTKQMYDRFARFEPKLPYAEEPGTPGERFPFDLDSLPDSGISFPAEPTDTGLTGAVDQPPEQPETPKQQKAPEQDQPEEASKPAADADQPQPEEASKPAADSQTADPGSPQPQPSP